MSGRLDWLIVGGGIHGTHLSHLLTSARGVPRDRVRVIDREAAPLAAFFRCVDATGMRYLRSPGVHHLDLHPYALLQFGATRRRLGGFVAPYSRPTTTLFRAHCDHVIARHRLDDLRDRAEVLELRSCAGGFALETSAGRLEARRVVLALGAGDRLARPAWAAARPEDLHVFDPGFRRGELRPGEQVAIIGGGISAAQLALAAVRIGARPLVLARHPLREHGFDSDPGWLGPKAMAGFDTRPHADRRRLVDAARHRGSMPVELARAVRRAVRARALRWLQGEVEHVERGEHGAVLTVAGAAHAVDRIVLATGFERRRPGGAWLDAAVEVMGLACAACGYPIVNRALEWAPGLHVTGALAELELGPTARNIAGARAAGERLAGVA